MPPRHCRKEADVRLETLQTALWRELCAPHCQAVFDRKKVIDFSISQFDTTRELLEFFDRRGPEPRIAQQFLLRVLIEAAQQERTEQLWRSILLYAYLPGLCAIRRRTGSYVHLPDELDAELWAVFMEVVEHYPLHRPGSVAAGVLLDTGKRYYQQLRRRPQEADAFEEFLEATSIFSDEERLALCFTRVSAARFTAMERGEMLAVLLRCDTIAPEDAELLWLTDVCGLTVQQALESQKIGNDNEPLEPRELDRAWRRRSRTRQRVQLFFKNLKVGVSSFGVDPACYLLRGKNTHEAAVTRREKSIVQHTLFELVAKLGRLMTTYKLGGEVFWGIMSVLDGVIEELLAKPTCSLAQGSLELHPVMAALLARFGAYGRPRATLRQCLSVAAS
jgi:hypothetical protein